MRRLRRDGRAADHSRRHPARPVRGGRPWPGRRAAALGAASAPAPGIIGLDGETVVLDPVVDDDLVPVVAGTDGEWVAYASRPAGPPAEGTIAAGRATSEIVAVSSRGVEVDVELAGNIVPEAFSLEPQGPGQAPWLYVLEYLPAEAPTHYRVRVLDPNTGELDVAAEPAQLRLHGGHGDVRHQPRPGGCHRRGAAVQRSTAGTTSTNRARIVSVFVFDDFSDR